jgi:hypothetical protein
VTLANAFIDGINRIYSTCGVAATHTDRDDTESSVTVIVDYDLSNYGDTAEVAQATATLSVRTSELSDIPRRGDTFVVGSRTFVVGGSLQSDELEHTVLVS